MSDDPVDSGGLEEEIANTADRVLARQAQTGDREAWQQLVNRHVERLCAYLGARVRRHRLVTKLVADTIFASWRHMSEWEPDKEDFASWFRRMGARVTLGWRQKNPDEPLSEDFPEDLVEDPVELERLRQLERAMGQLPENQRMCLEQHFRAGLDGRVLADVLHLSPAEAQGLLEQALDSLAAKLETHG